MRDAYLAHLRGTLEQIRADGFYKTEREIASPQRPTSGWPAARTC